MIVKSARRVLLSAVAVVALTASAFPAGAQMAVFDPQNYAQNLMTAARMLQQVNNQITSLQNQVRNLTNLPFSALGQLQAQVADAQTLLGQASRIAYDVNQIQQAFQTHYGEASLSSTEQALVSRGLSRWTTSVAAFEDALKVQAGVVKGISTSRTQMQALVSASQTSVGALQAAQAGNQLLALQASQLTQLTALMAAEGRAQALDAADRASAKADAQVRINTFLTTGQAYQPAPVQMFH